MNSRAVKKDTNVNFTILYIDFTTRRGLFWLFTKLMIEKHDLHLNNIYQD